MTDREAADWYDALQAKDSILSDTGAGILEQSKRLAQWSLEASRPAASDRQWTFGDVLHGAFGAAMGAGVARGVSNLLGVSPGMADKLETAAMGVGAAMNTGVIKRAEAQERIQTLAQEEGRVQRMVQMRKHAFRLGALRALVKTGYFGQQTKLAMIVPTINLNPTALLEFPRSIGQVATSGGSLAGTAAGLAVAPDEDEEDIAKLQVEKMMLDEQIESIRAERQNDVMRQILEARRKAGP